jgi:glycosyltransferase involved in cell wall biosynthesis
MTRSAKDYDVVHVHGLFNFTSVVAAWAARRARVPYVIRPFGVLAEYGLRHRRPRLKRASIRFVEGPLLSDAAAVHFTSEQEHQQAIPLGIPWRSVVIPLGVPMLPLGDPERLIRTLPADPMTCRIVSLSRIHPQKNLESLLVALRLLRSDGLRPSLLVAGTGEAAYVTALREFAIEQGVDDQVHWLGHVTGPAKADLFAAADLFALTSFSESYGLAVAEALAAGVPCIVSDGVALAALVRESRAGIVVEPDPASIASGVRTFLQSPERLQASAAAAGRVANAELSVRLMSERLIELYRSLVAA